MTSSVTTTNGTSLSYGIIGAAAGIVPTHVNALTQIPNMQIVGMADINEEAGAARAQETGCPFFVDHQVMLREVRPDVVIICTPHPFHATLAIDCFAAGVHVLVEKPIAVEVAEADAMIAAAEQANRILAVNYQQRFRPAVEYIYNMITSGELGHLVRVLCVEPWFRTDAYYRASTWRGTWQGEGGGVLLNQAPHTLDLLCHLAGMPTKVCAWTRTIAHPIETEDTAQGMLEFENGALGYLHVSTVEAGLEQRIQIVCDRAALELVGDKLILYRFEPSLQQHMTTSPELFAPPDVHAEEISLTGHGGSHVDVYRDLETAIREGRIPRADGREGLKSLELINAFILSSYTEQTVTLPIDRAAYTALLNDLRAGNRSTS
ncbi:MAG: Gfo/Idh/MocA family oxidoreductase [Chloroflexi bacterium AL-W]|nr:Gfo/Idh/MocA family oxidoreductase [Chloroflexi bacterium AL-N1]NOK64754.1 Gfo/Idh/MocA family oxidoreductase [Chloroflexi bacterium AL-N10]NOK75995.1 Gfo/Idh/MocA family oxidoreductase [Chloroflexi bacterium AL-N5]NOK80246.1 Gfo/Idh/MocA family oxidoreductase [Chloroflexi bacterium AL-W]NOK86759.1 Gfo/Idh/MocA family oxidoreductase [Chloroflexi bacterium AL-N15]